MVGVDLKKVFVYKAAIKPHYVYLMDNGYEKLTVVRHWVASVHVFPILTHIVREYLRSNFTGDVLDCQRGFLASFTIPFAGLS
jgi:hypothetical protein